MDRGALQHALEAGGRLGLAAAVRHQPAQLGVQVALEVLAQLVDVDAAGLEHGDRVRVLGERHEQVLERRVFVATLVGVGKRPMQALFEVAREHGREGSVPEASVRRDGGDPLVSTRP